MLPPLHPNLRAQPRLPFIQGIPAAGSTLIVDSNRDAHAGEFSRASSSGRFSKLHGQLPLLALTSRMAPG